VSPIPPRGAELAATVMNQNARQGDRGARSQLLMYLLLGASFLASCMTPPQQASHVSPPAPVSETERVFCSIKKTGQICEEGSSALLNLRGKQRESWLAAVRRYNEKLTRDQQDLIQNARVFLTPVQMDHVRAWVAAQKYTGQAAKGPRSGANKVSTGAGK
jgi:hypothetical protein